MKIHGVHTAAIVICMLFYHHMAVATDSDLQDESDRDIRILIDVSGSMRWNDPQNLRAPALRLVTGLLPKGTQAGVWTFGKYVNMLVPLGAVDNAWKEQARLAASQLHSKGLYTNIKDVLDIATRDWKEADDKSRRSIILLTDGLVDISEDVKENDQSRALILDTILPRIQKNHGTIYTIALSGEADTVLMQQLAAATNGRHEKAETAESLERIFFRMFEKAANPDTLPLVDNSVLVDESIEELTLLVFRKDGAAESQLSTPDNMTLGRESAPPNIHWHHEDRYDLITIDKPAPGTWHVNADVDPDNRVMVVTNLRMITTTLPNNISLGDEYTMRVGLTQDDKIIGKKEFLHFIKVNLAQHSSGEQWDWMLLDNGQGADEFADDGTYAVHLNETLVKGEHILTINVDGTTFKRVNRQVINVYDSPVMATITPDPAGQGFVLTVTPRAGMIEPASMDITVTITDNDENETEYTVPKISDNEWRLSLDYPHNKRHTAQIEITGERPNGKPIDAGIGPLYFGADGAAPTEKMPHEATESELSPDNMEQGQVTEMAEMDNPINWLYVSIQIVVFNILFAIGIFFGIKKWRKTPAVTPTPWDDLVHA